MTAGGTTARGFVADGYGAVRDTFQDLLDEGRETGAGLSVWRGGREVVQLNGGWADAARSRPWTADTLVQPYSVSKSFAALTAMVAVRDGALELDVPVATYWPAYGVNGKESVTLRHILTHQAGQPRFPDTAAGIDLLDAAALRDSLAQAPPEYPPGTRLGEHAMTQGHLIDGVLRAATGASLGELFHDVVRPALDVDAWFGVPDDALHRVADLEHADAAWPLRMPARPWLTTPDGVVDMALANSRAWRQSVFGAINIHLTASAGAAFCAELTSAEGPVGRLLGPELHREFVSTTVTGHDEVFDTRLSWTPAFIRDHGKIAKGGLGGSVVWWSRRHGHSAAYLTRRLDDHARAARLAAALGDDLSLLGED